MNDLHVMGLFFLGLAMLSGMAQASVARRRAKMWLEWQRKQRENNQ